MKLYLIDTGYACAGIEIDDEEKVTFAAPIFRWMIGKQFDEVRRWKKIKKIMESSVRGDEPASNAGPG